MAWIVLSSVLITLGGTYQYTSQCEGGNAFRRLDRARWEYVLGLVGNRPDPEGKLAAFRTYIVRADAQRDCWPLW